MATWSKLFTNFAWKNRPDTSTPLGQTLLNRLNNAINGIDDRVVTLNTEKASTADLSGSIVNVSLNSSTGIFTFTRFDGTTFTINTALEEVVTNFRYDYSTQQLVLTLADGTTQNIDLSALITQYEFTSSATILFTVGNDGKVTANIKPNSITDQMLQTNYLSDITTQANTALSASQSALESQSLAEQHAEKAEEEADRAEAAADRAQAASGITVDTALSTSSTNPIANKAVAEEFGKYLPKSGGYITGAEVGIGSANSESGYTFGLKNAKRFIAEQVLPDGTYRIRDTNNDKAIIKSLPNGTTTFEGTASGNVARSASDGQTVSAPSTRPIMVNNTHESSSYAAIGYYLRGTKLGEIGITNKNNLFFINAENVSVDILHTGNKPSGSYTGNGSATARTIAIGSIGKVFVVRQQGSTNFTIVTPSGYIGKQGNTVVCGTDAFADGGNLAVQSTSQLFNTSGAIYDYYSL